MKHLLVILLFTFVFLAQSIGQPISKDYQKTDLNQLHNFIDSLVKIEMEEDFIPGAVVVIVQDSHDVFINGYGMADVENQVPVDPFRTGFRIASVTKTFTATAILQLAERGLIDLHAPISTYLPDDNFSFLKFPSFTTHQLLTHTAGIDLTDISDAAVRAEEAIDLETVVRSRIPDIVNVPGKVHSYSNFGYTILGFLIQEISGMPYEEYIQKYILDPLKMDMSNMSQPLDEPMRSNLSKGYEWNNGYINLPRDYTNTVPGGGLISTANDMANYLLMHLNNGQKDSVTILSPAFHDLLTSQQYGSKNTKYGLCYSFFENGWTGRRSIDHSGGQLGFLSLFLIIPETGTGVFISHNSRKNANGFRYDVTTALLDTLLYRKERHIDLPEPSNRLNEIADNYTGRFQQMNYPHSSFEKFGQLFGFYNSAYIVKYEGDGLLDLNGDKYVMIEEDLFYRNDENNPWNVQFELNKDGSAKRIIAGTTSYERTAWYNSKKVWQRLLAFGLLVTLINLNRRPIINVYRKFKKQENLPRSQSQVSKWLRWTGALFILGFFGILLNLAIYQGDLADYGIRLSLKLPFLLNTIAGILACLSPYAIYKIWSEKYNRWNYLYVLALIILAIGFWKYNIIGFNY